VLPDGAELVMRVMPLPADTNSNGDIFGGWLMAQVDLAGAVLPARVARGRLATVGGEPVPVQAAGLGG
jgi:acyl-CoA thioesterase YciA